MKLSVALLSMLFAGATALKVSTPLGSKLMSKARRLEADDAADQEDNSWMADYSIKFQGCHHTLQYNDEADGDEDVKVYTKRLARFSLCPSDSCVDGSAYTCDSAGDYIVDLATFANSYTEAQMNAEEYACEQVRENCDCDGDDDAVDDQQCENTCYTNAGLSNCIVNDDEGEQFNVQEYLECAQFNFDNGNRRRLDAEEVEYFMGPYCSEQGGGVYLGIFTDDKCSNFADDNGGIDTYYSNTYQEALPYSSESIIGLDCVSCQEPQDNQNDGDQQDEDQIKEVCAEVYEMSGKCETNLSANGKYSSSNENACSYIEGISIVRQDGTVSYEETNSKAAAVFIGIFAVSFVLLGAYVYYLHQKLSRSKINLASE
mmetsp:Transcript_28616/g.42335  ORF Transcript_28616/g.42335 Transcript_28616/m.42335 type:complete len:373 (+) Transcript_28616:37-1155(+)|eukprot:CAMPEP_0195517192 /NCGR_PEP_ID=MMETSP0794_2-20130614/10228_1 /TAXON_ID=515487 /ORGANISM="Stephanopyxis turris, Strain CCMP 815" /LENGTH=372 /DNA_ID=CAMNT_0040645961 /DNA_START=37 /DNA_END=1155 /DNA_ORIENTATION=+